MSTTIPEVKLKLAELFKGVVDATATEVWLSPPSEDHQNAENVYIQGVRGTRVFVSLPANQLKSRKEDYSVQVSVEVWRPGTDFEGTEARLWVLVNLLEGAIAMNPSVGTNLEKWGLASSFAQSCLPTAADGEDGYLARYEFGVEVSARI